MFRGHQAHIESCCFISNGEFLSGSDDGCVALWNTMKKKPVFLAHGAHGGTERHHLNGYTANGEKPTEQSSTLAVSNGNGDGNFPNFQPIACAASNVVPYGGVCCKCYFLTETDRNTRL